VPHTAAETPDVQTALRTHPSLAAICGPVHSAEPQAGLSNRVYRIEADRGAFFLRLPRVQTAGMVDREAEASNIRIAADLAIALPPLYCDPDSGILLTRSIDAVTPPPPDLPARLGAAIGKLHASGKVFRGLLDADAVFRAQMELLVSSTVCASEINALDQALRGLDAPEVGRSNVTLVPSHGDLSPGNCLATPERLWLIDWEYSAMSSPAWDLAYAILEHGFEDVEETQFLKAYRKSGANELCPSPEQLEIMKSKCDAVSALWAYEQLRQGSDKTDFSAFARARQDRALARLEKINQV